MDNKVTMQFMVFFLTGSEVSILVNNNNKTSRTGY